MKLFAFIFFYNFSREMRNYWRLLNVHQIAAYLGIRVFKMAQIKTDMQWIRQIKFIYAYSQD